MNIHFHRVQPTGVADEAALEQFQKQWATYQKLVDADALSHKEVGTVLHDTLKAIPLPFAFLHIACGDAGQMRQALAGTKVQHMHRAASWLCSPAYGSASGRVLDGLCRDRRISA
jgi:hypothetical protein